MNMSATAMMAESGENPPARLVGATAILRQVGGVAEQQVEPLQCPRCESTNTKFCYYNNYNLLQPRHFCKSCRRYWTKGGALRNIPVGGGTRKPGIKRQRAVIPAPTTTSSVAPDIVPPLQNVAAGGDHFGYVPLQPSSGAGYGGYFALGSQPLFGRAGFPQPGSFEEMVCFGSSFNGKSMFPVAPMPDMFNSGIGACQFSDPADCFPWPELAISAIPGKGLRP